MRDHTTPCSSPTQPGSGPLPPARSRLIPYLLVLTALFTLRTCHMYGYVASAAPASTRAPEARVRPSQLHGEGRVYLVQLGPHTMPYHVVDMAAWLRETYSLDTEILPALPLEAFAYDASRHRYIAEQVLEQMKRNRPDLAADPNAVVIGFTDEEMYAATEHQSDTFTLRSDNHIAIITAHDMEAFHIDALLALPTPQARFINRLQRILLKNVAMLYWHLPRNSNPESVLYYVLNPDLIGSTLLQSDLDPIHSKWGEYVPRPCIVFSHTPGTTLTVPAPLIQDCRAPESTGNAQTLLASGEAAPDTSQERIAVDLKTGRLQERHTDFYLPGAVPIRFERVLTNLHEMPMAFGMSGSHNYDRFLGSHDGMRHIYIYEAGGTGIYLVRQPAWVTLLPLAKWIDEAMSGFALNLRWVTEPMEHFALTRFNGEVETYMPCTDAELCYLTGYQDPAGQQLTVTRDAQRTLMSLSAPGNNWLHLSHDDSQTPVRVTSILDSQGHSVRYTYNARGQLSTVHYPSGETITYTWDSSQNLLSVASTLAGSAPVVLITNQYDRGRLIAQTLADGSVYHYAFLIGTNKAVEMAQVTMPNGTCYQLALNGSGATFVRACERTPQTSTPTNERIA